MKRAEDASGAIKPTSKKRKRDEQEEEPVFPEVPMEDAVAEETGMVEVEASAPAAEEALEPAPAKKAKKPGRPLAPDPPCEHGSTVRKCQKCIYRVRVERAITKWDSKGGLARLLFMWMNNLVYFGSLASVLALPTKDPAGVANVIHVVEHRVGQFVTYKDVEMKKLSGVEEVQVPVVNMVFETVTTMAPATVETVYMAKWLLARNETWLKDTVGEVFNSLTIKVAALWEENMQCPGITDLALLEHFKYWKGTVWKRQDGAVAIRLAAPEEGQETIRSLHCNGFSSDGLCYRCSLIRRHLMKEKSAYKNEPPGVKLLLQNLPPGYRAIFDKLRLNTAIDPVLLGPAEEVEDEELPPQLMDANGDIPPNA